MALIAQNLTVQIGKRILFQDISLTCPKGTALAIVGSSGAGKTTLLNTLSLMLPVQTGTVEIDGVKTHKWSERKIRHFWRDKASFIVQDAGLDDTETVAYNISLQKRMFNRRIKDTQLLKAAELVGLANRLTSPVIELSGGEQRRVAIARAIYKGAEFLFADEPTASLDAQNRELVEKLLIAQARQGAAVIISTHDQQLAAACDQIIELQKR